MTGGFATISESKYEEFKGNKLTYLDSVGYCKATDYKVKIEGSNVSRNVWRRVFRFCISTSGTLFVNTKEDKFLVVNRSDLEK